MAVSVKTSVSLGTAKVAFSNTPQANDDTFSVTENTTNWADLDVMSNDLGGAAKTLWSIDDGSNSLADLLTPDALDVEGMTTLGNSIRIHNGVVQFKLAQSLDYLQASESVTDSFTYAIRLANGTLAWATTTVQIDGTNDTASMTGNATGSVTEDGPISTGGLLTVSDADHDQAYLQPENGTGDNGYGSFTINADGHWSYVLDNAAAQHLAAGAEVTDTYTVWSKDGTASQLLTVTITGTNDAPVVSGAVLGTATEDASPATLDALAKASDVDDNTTLSVVLGSDPLPDGVRYDATTHSFSLDPSNAAYQHLAADQTTTVTVSYGVSDGTATTPASVSWTITGTNDPASITGVASGDVTEDGTLTTSGKLTVSDADGFQSVFQMPASLAGTYGNFSFNATTGGWGYSLNNAVQSLGATDTATDKLTVISLDGTATQDIVVTIHGTNDGPTFSGNFTGSVTEDATPNTASGSVTVSDLDAGQSGFQTVNSNVAGQYGTWTLSGTGATKNWTYALDNTNTTVNALNNGQALHDMLDLVSTDGTHQTLDVLINGHTDNLAPVATGERIILSNNTTNNTALLPIGVFTANDVDPEGAQLSIANVVAGNGFTVSSTSNPGYLAFTLSNIFTGDTTGHPDYGTASVTYQVSDGSLLSNTATINIIVLNVGSNTANTWDLQSFTPYAASYVDGQSGADSITGASVLNGGMGKDWIFGGNNNDIISGGAGDDVLTGGGNADTFVFAKGYGKDIITDWTPGNNNKVDAIHLDVAFATLTQTVLNGDLHITSSGWNTSDELIVKGVTSAIASAWFV